MLLLTQILSTHVLFVTTLILLAAPRTDPLAQLLLGPRTDLFSQLLPCPRTDPCSSRPLLEEDGSSDGGDADPGVALVDVDTDGLKVSRDNESDDGEEVDESHAADGFASVSTLHTEGVGRSGKGQSRLSEHLGGEGLEGSSLREAPGLEGELRGETALGRGQGNVAYEVLEDVSGIVGPTNEGLGDKELDADVDKLHGDVDTELSGGTVEEGFDRVERTRDEAPSNSLEGGNVREDGGVERNGGGSLVAAHERLKEGADAVG